MEQETKRIIFHHPDTIQTNGSSGSSLRPYKMLQAFKALGYQVDEVTGTANERKASIKVIKKRIQSGEHYSFLYAENRSIPTALTEHHRLPNHLFLDHLFFLFCKNSGIPVGLFYRDVYWRHPVYKTMLPLIGRIITIPLYWFDWLWHRMTVTHLFVPSLRMSAYLPGTWPTASLSALPPGCDVYETPNRSEYQKKESGSLELLYVGGSTPPNYDLLPLLELAHRVEQVRLTIITRESEWKKNLPYYKRLLGNNITIIHASGSELNKYYASADLFANIRSYSDYLKFAVPVKLFEAASFGLPILSETGTEAADIIRREDLGWVEENLAELEQRLHQLAVEKNLIVEKRRKMKMARHHFTWKERAQQVSRTLSSRQTT